MPRPADPPAPTEAQLTRCAALWDSASRVHCEAILHVCGGYRYEVLQDFALYRWAQMGHEVQRDLARAMIALAALLRTVPL